ncbi:DUF6895 family protein, partial [Streptomyces resistomycificus]
SLPRLPEPAVLADAWASIGAAQDASGAVPEVGPGRGEREPERTFATCYHSTLMTAFAAAVTLARLREAETSGAPPAGSSGRPAPGGQGVPA